ncbi:MAG: sugar transferase [Clostridium sp.]|uniref:sugar transferase n=1 Tax=Clostridium sp. TaxID=1506 RepID=UPI002A8415CC|nr:sugar transferase [Clostridium sp.]MDY4252018.1 sugar transferase [Clostridium sp.]MDY6229135.1 sugar transferase [Clostridium sp.]
MFLKRSFDFICALIALILLFPILIIIAILIRIKLGSPIFFLQERVGKDNKVFKIIKFRTMRDIRDKNGNLLADEERMTSFGKTMRSLSIDELPELINILKGDMSIVGPRPLLVQYLSLYNDEQIKRHNTLPGLTGWAQINGRNNLSWNEKFDLDLWYVKNRSFKLDLKIIFLTIYKVIKREDINKEGQATTEYFNGMN